MPSRFIESAVTAATAGWLGLAAYGLVRLSALVPAEDADPDPLPDLGRVVWLVLGFWVAVGIGVATAVLRRR